MVAYPYYDKDSRTICFDADDGRARPGARPATSSCSTAAATIRPAPISTWTSGARSPTSIAARGLIPFVDLAYQGLGNGLEADAAGTRLVVEAAEQAIVAQSCDKNFGCYRDRLGTLFVKASSARGAEIAFGNLLGLARTMWSMPPDHGAAVARIILDDPELRADWRCRARGDVRADPRSCAPGSPPTIRGSPISSGQNGMFSMLPLSPEQVLELREEQGIYMAGSGRFNVVGLSDDSVDRFAAAVVEKMDG